ncbi:MAG: type II toxin-antitoxin system HicA family toxin [Ignavibacteriae bacterium]|nr:type II toxin-antitoxin system HicA family toxin [Ignavibacteria bacterium]MBI3364730.1 type II toxin-antitoxin system HicA family toxin [Ignavibacteriota bacterium]
MPNLRTVPGAEAVRALERLGFRQVRQRGSHVIMRKETPDGAVGCAIPLHKELKIGTLRGILRQAKVESDDFLAKL